MCHATPNKQGRRGDPRMHKAVSARLNNPKLSLIDALRIGGFNVSAAEDDQGVTLIQRKNQLSRRLRIFRRQTSTVSAISDYPMVSEEEQRQPLPKPLVVPHRQKQQETIGEVIDPSLKVNIQSSSKASNDLSAATPASADNIILPNIPTFHEGSIPQKNVGNADDCSSVNFSCDVKHTSDRDNYISSLLTQIEVQGQLLKSLQHKMVGPLAHLEETENMKSLHSELAHIQKQVNLHNQGLGLTSQQTVPPQDQCHQKISNSDNKRLSEQLGDSSNTCDERDNEVRKRFRQQQSISVEAGHHSSCSHIPTEAPFKHTQYSSYSADPMKMQMALTLYKSETSAAIQRCMATAGFSPTEIMENHPAYLLMVSKAVENEVERVHRLRELFGGQNTYRINIPWSSCAASCAENVDSTPAYLHSRERNELTHSLPSMSTCPDENYDNSVSARTEQKGCEKKRYDGRHMHRLMGRCGHQAIVHYPPGGRPHVDFIVGNRIECYQNVSPTNLPTEGDSGETVWPSRYKCIEVQHVEGCAGFHHDPFDFECKPVLPDDLTPSLLDTSAWENDDEWNFDFLEGSSDEMLLGLIELGKVVKGTSATEEEKTQSLNEDKEN
jgi:hypothetical protein